LSIKAIIVTLPELLYLAQQERISVGCQSMNRNNHQQSALYESVLSDTVRLSSLKH